MARSQDEDRRRLRDRLLCGAGDHRGGRRRDGTSSSVDCVRGGAGNGLCLLGISLPAVLRKAVPAETADAVAIGSHSYRHPVPDSFALSVREAGNSADRKSARCVNVLNALPKNAASRLSCPLRRGPACAYSRAVNGRAQLRLVLVAHPQPSLVLACFKRSLKVMFSARTGVRTED